MTSPPVYAEPPLRGASGMKSTQILRTYQWLPGSQHGSRYRPLRSTQRPVARAMLGPIAPSCARPQSLTAGRAGPSGTRRARPASIASAGTPLNARAEPREQLLQALGAAQRALRGILASLQELETRPAVLAPVLEDRHGTAPSETSLHLGICGRNGTGCQTAWGRLHARQGARAWAGRQTDRLARWAARSDLWSRESSRLMISSVEPFPV